MTRRPLTRRAGLTQARLFEVIVYDPLTGAITSLRDIPPNVTIGGRFGWRHKKGWNLVRVDGVTYRSTHIIWLYMKGKLPPKQRVVDHKNRVRHDDRWDNLRLATNVQNGRNASLSKLNTSGVKGVRWHKRIGKWHADIRVKGKALHLGYFDTLEAGAAARRTAEIELFGEFSALPNGEIVGIGTLTNAS